MVSQALRDPVGEELQRRAAEPLPWRSALLAALALHAVVAVLVTIHPGRGRRSLQLPSVQVRMVAPLPAGGARPLGPATVAPAAPRKTVAPPRAKPAKAQAVPRAAAPPAKPPARRTESQAPTPAQAPAAATGGEEGAAGTGTEPGAVRSAGGAIGLGAGNGSTDEQFPFTYYLSRFVGLVEGNWFRPSAPPETRCRIRCRIDRSGRLLEAGIEEPSLVPAFDRAALRAIFASAPFPPLPQAFAGQTLTLHLDFGPQA